MGRILSRYAVAISAAATLLGGCGGSQPIAAAPRAMPQLRETAQSGLGEARLPSKATSGDLLYVADGEYVKIYTYPQGEFVATLGNFGGVHGMCSDAAGDVYIPEYYQNAVLEYAHGGSSPIATINTIYNFPTDCSVDPTTGNLAVTIYNEVEVFKNGSSGWGLPTGYADYALGLMNYCSYDGSGNLFVDGFDGSYQLAELPAGSSSFTNVSLNRRVKAVAYGVMWDGQDIVIASGWRSRKFPTPIYRFSISGNTGTLVGITKLRRSGGQFHQFWLQGNKIIGTAIGGESTWGYPQGGLPNQLISGVGGAVTVSVAASR
jgi:hypothetical protein